MKTFMQKWRWAYRKIRSWHCGPVKSAFRALLYAWRGHTGHFMSHDGHRKSCIHQ